LDSNKKHNDDFGELVQKLLLRGGEVVEQWMFSVICSCVFCMQVKPSPLSFSVRHEVLLTLVSGK